MQLNAPAQLGSGCSGGFYGVKPVCYLNKSNNCKLLAPVGCTSTQEVNSMY